MTDLIQEFIQLEPALSAFLAVVIFGMIGAGIGYCVAMIQVFLDKFRRRLNGE